MIQLRPIALALLALLPLLGHTASTNTARILSDTLAALPQCLSWRIEGMCLWLDCDLTGCSVKTSLKVSHYAPDAVVTVRNDIATHPWTEATPILAASYTAASALLGTLDGGGYMGESGRDKRRHQIYREADVIGHPLGAAGFLTAVTWVSGILCPPMTWPLYPYFISELDAAVWRAQVPAELLYPASWIPGLRDIGTFPLNTWGNVHPRTGRVTQQDEPKAAAVIAQRAGDIVTRTGQPHIYTPFSAYAFVLDPAFRVSGPPPLREGDADTGVWQMLEPKTDNTCYVFGGNDSLAITGWSDGFPTGRRDEAGDYVFNLWRYYECCRRRGAYIGSVP